MKENESFTLRKPMGLVRGKWSRNATRMDVKFVHLIQMEIKKWALLTGYKLTDAVTCSGLKVGYFLTIEDLALKIGSSKRSLLQIEKDGKRRIEKYLLSANSVDVTVKIDTEWGVFEGSATPIATATYSEETGQVFIETTHSMGISLLHEALRPDYSFVDMELQMRLRGNVACHILDRISRFKGIDRNMTMTIGDLIEQCGIDIDLKDIKGRGARSTFISNNIRRPLKQIMDTSNGMWKPKFTLDDNGKVKSGSETGYIVTSKKTGHLLMKDTVTFYMRYDASAKPKHEVEEKGGDDFTLDDIKKMLEEDVDPLIAAETLAKQNAKLDALLLDE